MITRKKANQDIRDMLKDNGLTQCHSMTLPLISKANY